LGDELKAIRGWCRVTATGDLGRFPIISGDALRSGITDLRTMSPLESVAITLGPDQTRLYRIDRSAAAEYAAP